MLGLVGEIRSCEAEAEASYVAGFPVPLRSPRAHLASVLQPLDNHIFCVVRAAVRACARTLISSCRGINAEFDNDAAAITRAPLSRCKSNLGQSAVLSTDALW